MHQPTRSCTPELKREAVQLRETSGKSGTVIAQELGISDTVLYHWRKERQSSGETAFLGTGYQND